MTGSTYEAMKIIATGPIPSIIDRRKDILSMNQDELDKIALILGSVAWCGGFGCGHGAEALNITPPPETVKAIAAGPIPYVFDRRKDIVEMDRAEITKIAEILGSVAWCGGGGCGHGAESIDPGRIR